MYNILQSAHSGLRWLVLLALLGAIFKAFQQKRQNPYPGKDKLVLFGMIFTHVQILLGLVLYFMSPKVTFAEGFMGESVSRFYAVEHIAGMLIAAVLITMGYSKAKRLAGRQKGWSTVANYYLIGLIIILLSIPWPFREGLGGGWF